MNIRFRSINRIIILLPPPFIEGAKDLNPRDFPLQTLTLATYLKNHSFHVELWDAFMDNLDFSDVERRLSAAHPDLILIPLGQINREIPFELVFRLHDLIHNRLPDVPVVLFYRHFLKKDRFTFLDKHPGVAFMVFGDAEIPVLRLIESLNGRKIKYPIKGVFYRFGDRLRYPNGPYVLDDMDPLPFPDFHLVSRWDRYVQKPHRYRNRNFYPLEEARGCRWGKCAFCSEASNQVRDNLPYRCFSPERVVSEMNHAYREYGVSEIQFCSAQFPTQIEWLTSFRDLLKQNELKMEWSCHSRVDMVSTESLELMKECGCKNILFGMESFEIGTLDRIGKNIHPEQVVQAVFECRKSRIETTGSFMMALPSEKPGAVVRNALKAVTMGIDYFQLFIAKWEVIPPQYEMFFIQRSSWETSPFDYCGVALIPDGYKNMRHLKMIKMLAYLVFYLHPRTLFRFLMKIRGFSDLKRFLSGFYVLSKLTGTSLKKQPSSLSFRTEADALEKIP